MVDDAAVTRCLCLVLLLGACGGGGDARPVTYVHADPAFALDMPAGFAERDPGADPLGQDFVDLQGERASLSITVSWGPGPAPAAARDTFKANPDGKVVAEGDLPGGHGVWIETDYLGGTVGAWMAAGELVVICEGSSGGARSGRDALLAACKTLRPAP